MKTIKSETSKNGLFTLRLKYNRNVEEFQVMVTDNKGKRAPELDYFTDDKTDAILTMGIMADKAVEIETFYFK